MKNLEVTRECTVSHIFVINKFINFYFFKIRLFPPLPAFGNIPQTEEKNKKDVYCLVPLQWKIIDPFQPGQGIRANMDTNKTVSMPFHLVVTASTTGETIEPKTTAVFGTVNVCGKTK